MTRAMIPMPGRGALTAAVEVYRDGEAVVVVGEGTFIQKSPFGDIEAHGRVMVRFPNDSSYNWSKARAFDRNPAAYVRNVGTLGIDDDAAHAPNLPRAWSDLVRAHMAKQHPSFERAVVVIDEPKSEESSSSSSPFPPLLIAGGSGGGG
jgi:hypothetical protein